MVSLISESAVSMKNKPCKIEEEREVEVEDELEAGWKKFVTFKGDIPSKKIRYQDPAGNSYKNLKAAIKKMQNTKVKELKAVKKEKEKKSKKRKPSTQEASSSKGQEESVRTSPAKKRNSDTGAGEESSEETEMICEDCGAQFADAILLAKHNSKFHKRKVKLERPGKPKSTIRNLEDIQFQCEVPGQDIGSEVKDKTDKKKKDKVNKDGKKKDNNTKDGTVDGPALGPGEARAGGVGGPPGPPPAGEEQEEKEEDCFCEECGVEFTRRSLLRNHMLVQHGLETSGSSAAGDSVTGRESTKKSVSPERSFQTFDYYDEEEEEYFEEEEFSDDEDVVEVEIPYEVNVTGPVKLKKECQDKAFLEDANEDDEDDDYEDPFSDEEVDPEEITLDGDEQEDDDEVIIDEVTQNHEEDEREKARISKFESVLSAGDILEFVDKPDILQKVNSLAWWCQPTKWKPTNNWEVWHASLTQVCAHYKLKDVPIGPEEKYESYDDFDQKITLRFEINNPCQSMKTTYTWKKAKWFSFLDPVIPDDMKIVEETLEDDD